MGDILDQQRKVSQAGRTAANRQTISVRIAQLGRKVMNYSAPEPIVLHQALEAVGIIGHNMDVRVNGVRALGSESLRQGDLVTVVPMIKGGR